MELMGRSSIRQKLTNVVVFTCFFGLAVACAGFEYYERENFRSSLTEEVTALADTVGEDSAAAMTFEDEKTAGEILGGLRAEPHIVAAFLYGGDGKAFAKYQRAGGVNTVAALQAEGEGTEFTDEALTVRRNIRLGDERIGTIAIVYELSGFHAKMRQYAGITAIVLVFSVLSTMVISGRLLKPITKPLLELAGIAGQISASEDYTVRAVARTKDEVGNLVHSFNQMLERIEERDSALKEAKDELERRVEERTAELQREVNERELAQEKLQASLKDLKDLQFALDQHCIVMRTDAQGTISYVNDALCKVTGYQREELLGESYWKLRSKDHSQEFYAELWKLVRSGQTWKGEIKNVAKDGSDFWSDATIVPFCNASGTPVQLIAIRTNITNLKRTQEELLSAKITAEQASRAKSEFLANMSHEIRTPLNGIMGMTDLALDTTLSHEQREYLETVKTSSDALLTVINDILDFSKIEAGKMELEEAEFDLRETVESTLKTLAVRANEKKLELLCDVAAGVPDLVRGDAVRLRQVILNLTGNAIKFTDHGEVMVKVEKAEEPANAEGDLALHFTVSDTGVGILPSKLEMIFDPFSQADTSTTRKYGGTGLGLTISARLVRMMGGRIWVESEMGVGSKFQFTVHVAACEGKPHRKNCQGLPERLRGLRVLVVDDNVTNRRILSAMLSNWCMKPLCAESGEQALALLDAAAEGGETYPLIVTDAHMPEMDGFDLIERIRQRPYGGTPTIVMLTSAGGRGDTERCENLNVAAYLLKPIRQAELKSAILRVMEERGQPKAILPEPVTSKKEPGAKGEPLRILVAEDNAVNQRLIVRMLEKRGHQVTVAMNGREAASAAEQGKFDLVLMDVQMPEMDGFEATATIRAREKGSGEHLTIIALTAHAMKGDREKCLDKGMDDYLTKPLQPKELDELLTRHGVKAAVKA